MSVTEEAQSLIEGGKLDGLVQKFKDEGLDKQVSSWVAKGENIPVAGDQIKKVLGENFMAFFARVEAARDKLASEAPATAVYSEK